MSGKGYRECRVRDVCASFFFQRKYNLGLKLFPTSKIIHLSNMERFKIKNMAEYKTYHFQMVGVSSSHKLFATTIKNNFLISEWICICFTLAEQIEYILLTNSIWKKFFFCNLFFYWFPFFPKVKLSSGK